jgi:hypothetical protein
VNSDGAGGIDQFAVRVDGFHFSDGLGDVHVLDAAATQRDHLHETTLGDEVDGSDAEAGTENPIIGRGRAAALGVAEDGDAHFFLRALADGFSDEVADADALGYLAVAGDVVLAYLLGNGYTLGQGDDGELLSEDMALTDVVANLLDAEGDFGDQDDVGAAGDSGVQGDPARVASHHFDDHDAVMRFGGGVDAVDGVGGDVDGGVKTEGHVGSGKVVVDGLGNSDDGEALLGEIETDLLSAVTADDNQRVKPHGLCVVDDFVGIVADGFDAIVVDAIGEGIATVGGAEDRSATGQNAAHIIEQQGAVLLRPDEAVKAVVNTNDLVAVLEDGGFYGGANDCVETGTVPSAGADADFSDLRHEAFGMIANVY